MDNIEVCVNECPHNFQFIEKTGRYLTGDIGDVKYYYIFYCTRCGVLIHLECPV